MKALSTIPTDSPEETQVRSAWLRRAGVVLLLGFVGAASFLGVRTRTVSAAADGVNVTVTYPSIGRRGLTTPLKVQVRTGNNSPDSIVVWINNTYLAELDHNNWVPEPTEVLARGSMTGLVYEPEGDFLEMIMDTRFAPSVSPGPLHLQMTIEASSEAIDFQLSTWVVP